MSFLKYIFSQNKFTVFKSSDEVSVYENLIFLYMEGLKVNQEQYKNSIDYSLIAEAYEILSDTAKREDYHYKRVYTYNYTFREAAAHTPQSVLKDCTTLKNIIDSSDPFRINRDALFFSIEQILSDNNLYLLEKENDKTANRKIIETTLYCSGCINFIQQMETCKKLQTLSGKDENLELMIQQFLNQQKKYKLTIWKTIQTQVRRFTM